LIDRFNGFNLLFELRHDVIRDAGAFDRYTQPRYAEQPE
jgi:hypothetical protein